MTSKLPERKVCSHCEGTGSVYDPPLEQQDREYLKNGSREWVTKIPCPVCEGSGWVVDCPRCYDSLDGPGTRHTFESQGDRTCPECLGKGTVPCS